MGAELAVWPSGLSEFIRLYREKSLLIRRLDYCLTQALTAHGVYRFFPKSVLDEIMRATCTKIGNDLTSETLVPTMTVSRSNWESVHTMTRDIMI